MKCELVVTRTELVQHRVKVEAWGTLSIFGYVDKLEFCVDPDQAPRVGATLEVTITEVPE